MLSNKQAGALLFLFAICLISDITNNKDTIFIIVDSTGITFMIAILISNNLTNRGKTVKELDNEIEKIESERT